MRHSVYNASIPSVRNSAPGASKARVLLEVILFLIISATWVHATDWSVPEQQLAQKIVAVTGPGAVAITIENRSSLGQREVEIVTNGMRSALEAVGLRSVGSDQSVAAAAISLSQNPSAYVWVAEIRQGSAAPVVVLVSMPRPESTAMARESVPLSLRKTLLWSQPDRILDVLLLDDSGTHIAVLSAENVSFYRMQNGNWQPEQSLSIAHARPWPRDLRGRLISDKDHLLDLYLPGVICHVRASTPLALNCRESDDPWPLLPASLTSPAPNGPGITATRSSATPMNAFFSGRNFFTGALSPGIGKFTTVSKFYSAAPIPREKYTLWLFASADGLTHMVDGFTDQAAKLNWGSDLASVRSGCGAGWQLLATSSGGQNGDSVRAYEFPDRDPVPVTEAVDFPGDITALWTESKGDSAIAIATDRERGNYEAFRLALACSQ